MVQIDHINISAPAEILAQEKQFFCTLLSLNVGFRPAFSRPGYWLYAQDSKTALIHLTQSDHHQPAPDNSYFDHVAFQCTGITAYLERLAALSIPFTSDYLAELAMTQLFFRAPSGTGVELNFIQDKHPLSAL